MLIETKTIQIQHDSGHESRMRLVTKASVQAFSPKEAGVHGFKISIDGKFWNREATPALIEAELARTVFPTEALLNGEIKPVGKSRSWKLKP